MQLTINRLERIGNAIEDILVNVVESTEQEARGGVGVTVLALPVLALQLIDLLRSLAGASRARTQKMRI